MTGQSIGSGIFAKGKNIYEVQASFGSGNKRKRISRTVHGTIKDARKAKAELAESLDNGLSLQAERTTLKRYLLRWLKIKEPRITHATLANYRNYINKWIIPYLGGVLLKEMKKHHIDDWHMQTRHDGISGRTLQAAHKVLKQALRAATAEEDQLMIRNPCDLVDTPRAEAGERGYLEIPEIKRMLALLDITDDAFSIAVRLGIATGARRGEILGLQWREVDLEDARISIKYSLTQVDGAKAEGIAAKQLKAPKTKNSRRVIAIDPDMTIKLREWKRVQAQQLKALGLTQKLDTPVCSSLYSATYNSELKFAGRYLDPQNFGKTFAKFCEANNFYSSTGKRLCFHELRHTQATLLINHGEDLVNVSRRLGHHSPSLTMNMYAHAMPGKDRKCAELMGSLISVSPSIHPKSESIWKDEEKKMSDKCQIGVKIGKEKASQKP